MVELQSTILEHPQFSAVKHCTAVSRSQEQLFREESGCLVTRPPEAATVFCKLYLSLLCLVVSHARHFAAWDRTANNAPSLYHLCQGHSTQRKPSTFSTWGRNFHQFICYLIIIYFTSAVSLSNRSGWSWTLFILVYMIDCRKVYFRAQLLPYFHTSFGNAVPQVIIGWYRISEESRCLRVKCCLKLWLNIILCDVLLPLRLVVILGHSFLSWILRVEQRQTRLISFWSHRYKTVGLDG